MKPGKKATFTQSLSSSGCTYSGIHCNVFPGMKHGLTNYLFFPKAVPFLVGGIFHRSFASHLKWVVYGLWGGRCEKRNRTWILFHFFWAFWDHTWRKFEINIWELHFWTIYFPVRVYYREMIKVKDLFLCINV